jgi:glycosyltransferase involved in cell wall biosynthesis
MSRKGGTVLFLSHDASRTGAPIFLLRFAGWLRESHDMHFQFLVGKSGELVPDFKMLGELDLFEPRPTIFYRGLRRLNLHHSYRSRHLARLRKKLLSSDVRVVYANSVASEKMVEFVHAFINCPVVCHVHELEWSIRDLGMDVMSKLEKQVTVYIAVSRAVKANLMKTHGIQESKIELIPGFIPVSEYTEAGAHEHREKVRLELGVPTGAKVACACGSIEPRKGTDIFMQVAKYASQNFRSDPIHFIWVGGSPRLVDRMRRQAASLSLGDVIHFVGAKRDTLPYFDASDVFLLTSREESLSLVMMEAAARRKPIICFSGSGGAPEFVENDIGYAISDFDATKMADRLIELVQSPDLCRNLGTMGAEKVAQKHDLNKRAPEIAAVIESNLVHSAAKN